MRLGVWLIVPLVLALLGVGAWLRLREVQGTYATSGLAVGICQANGEIAEETRQELSSAALSFLELFARSPNEARELMSERGRAATVDRASLEGAHAIYRSMETVSPPVVTETYLVRFLGGSEGGSRVPCGFVGGRAAFVSRGGTLSSAVVLVAEEFAGGSGRTTSVWIERENGAWRIRALNFGISRIVGKGSAELWEAARNQRGRGNDFNAAMLYAAARSALQRGPFYQDRLMQDFNADISTFLAPDIVRGDAPFTWTFGGETFEVTQVQYVGFESGDVALVIDHAPSAWTENAEAEAINRRLIDSFSAAYPEWREVFDAVVARAAKPNSNQRWGTVYRRSVGYSDTPNIERQGDVLASP
ncbi:MAG TPA: hypothetical protein VEA80_13220 [Vitreimonas sp.]|uniref:hypothetical protein n=1 Tax=Vitreimonas sp. TaxID=3069702 RepID=UPI002D6103AC|nr:hypothetical protein [Vitreimonas sp.]HYD88430.1 hypothetical protein [Vitreimonas sp.]